MALQELAGYTLAEVAQHNTEGDLWLVIGDAVVDATAWAAEHPGGKQVLLQHAGKDATAAFEGQHHSADARKRLQELQIGLLLDQGEEESGGAVALDAPDLAAVEGGGDAVDRSSKKATWQPDAEASACGTCDTRFILFSRKHHCRACGKIFCAKCANYWLYLPAAYGCETDVPQRLCKACFKEVADLDQSRHWDRWGPPDADKAVVLLHDATFTRRMWLPIAEALAHEYAVYAVDLPGHGSRMDEELDIKEAFDVVRQVIDDEIAPKKALVWGHGTGGYLALTFAATNPECTLGVIATSVGASADTAAGRFTNATFSLAYKAIPNSTLASRVKANLATFGVQLEEELVQKCLVGPGTYFEKWDGIIGVENLDNYEELLQAIRCKVLFVNGEKEVRVAEERFLTASKHGELKTVEGASWLFVLDKRHRDSVLALFREFASALPWGQEYDAEDETAEDAVASGDAEMVERPVAPEAALAQPEPILEEPSLDEPVLEEPNLEEPHLDAIASAADDTAGLEEPQLDGLSPPADDAEEDTLV